VVSKNGGLWARLGTAGQRKGRDAGRGPPVLDNKSSARTIPLKFVRGRKTEQGEGEQPVEWKQWRGCVLYRDTLTHRRSVAELFSDVPETKEASTHMRSDPGL